MTKRGLKKNYQPPSVSDLSAYIANGDDPLGVCDYGGIPYTSCVAGTGVYQPTCVSGDYVGTPSCTVGSGVGTQPQCREGASALTGCLTGGAAG